MVAITSFIVTSVPFLTGPDPATVPARVLVAKGVFSPPIPFQGTVRNCVYVVSTT